MARRISNWVVIAAAVPVLALAQIAGGGGSGTSTDPALVVLAPDTYANLPTAETPGRIFPATNSHYDLIRDNGVSWDHFFDGRQVTPPPSTGWTAINQGSRTVSHATGAMVLIDDAASTAEADWFLYHRAAPTAPYTITARVRFITDLIPTGTTEPLFVIGFRQSSDGKLHFLQVKSGTDDRLEIASVKWTDENTFSAEYDSAADMPVHNDLWLRIADNNTNRIVSYSVDGESFNEYHSIGRTDFLTADQVLVGISSGGGTSPDDYVSLTVISWDET